MKILQVLILIFLFTAFVKAQACGYPKLMIFLTDVQGNIIKDAEIKTFDDKFLKEDKLHFPRDKDDQDLMKKGISFSEERQAYFGSEGMCGGHQSVGLKITAKNFEAFEKVIDLPLGWTSFSVKLKHQNSNEVSSFTALNRIEGRVRSLSEDGIPTAKIIAYQNEKTQFQTHTDSDGDFELFLPKGNYRFTISAEGFKKTKIEKVEILADKINELNITMIISEVTEHPPIIGN